MKAAPPPPHHDQLIFVRRENLPQEKTADSLIFKSTSGKSSKLEVSSMDLTRTGMAAGRSLMWDQSTPSNQCSTFISSIVLTRSSMSLQNLHTKRRKDDKVMPFQGEFNKEIKKSRRGIIKL